MDNRKNNTGQFGNKGGGRPSKKVEIQLIESLDSLINSEDVILKLKELIEAGNFAAIKLYFDRKYGKVTEVIENHNVTSDFNIKDIFCFEDSKKGTPGNLEPIDWIE